MLVSREISNLLLSGNVMHTALNHNFCHGTDCIFWRTRVGNQEQQLSNMTSTVVLSGIFSRYFLESPNVVGKNSNYLLVFSIQKKMKHHMRHSFLKL